jgi:hypothetical protein
MACVAVHEEATWSKLGAMHLLKRVGKHLHHLHDNKARMQHGCIQQQGHGLHQLSRPEGRSDATTHNGCHRRCASPTSCCLLPLPQEYGCGQLYAALRGLSQWASPSW